MHGLSKPKPLLPIYILHHPSKIPTSIPLYKVAVSRGASRHITSHNNLSHSSSATLHVYLEVDSNRPLLPNFVLPPALNPQFRSTHRASLPVKLRNLVFFQFVFCFASFCHSARPARRFSFRGRRACGSFASGRSIRHVATVKVHMAAFIVDDDCGRVLFCL